MVYIFKVWKVFLSKKVIKQLDKLPPRIKQRFDLLAKEIEVAGPIRINWAHFGALKGTGEKLYHCHLKSGRPTYVACWEIINNEVKIVEVYYVGTHEKAPY